MYWVAPAPAQLVEARGDDQPMQPAVEPVRVAQPRDVAPRADAGVLHRVAGKLRVADDESRGTVEPGERRVEQGREGDLVALSRPLHEASLLHGVLRVGTLLVDVLEHYGAAQRPKVQWIVAQGRGDRVLAFETRSSDSDIA